MDTQVPADLSAMSDEDLAALEGALVEEFDGAVEAGSQDVAMLTQLADAVDQVRAELSDRETKAAQAAEALRALTDRVHGGMMEDEGETEIEVEMAGAMSVADSAAPSPEDTQIVAEPVAELSAETSNPASSAAEVNIMEAPAVTASVRKPSASAVRQYAPQAPAPEPRPEVVITAAADIPGYVAGAQIGLLDVAKALHAKARTLSNGSPRIPVASFSTGVSEDLRLGSDLSYNLDVLAKVRNPQALLASGGWCAPSQNYYELLGLDGGDGLIDLPTVQITRGGINVPDFIGISEATGALWTWTEATDENPGENIKQCLQIPCPTFTDYRLIAEGLCLTHGNLSDRAFPELTQRFIQLTLNAHLHRLSGAIINTIAGGATAFSSATLAPSSALGNLLHSIELARQDFLSKFLMPVNSVLEVVAPVWIKPLIRNEIAMRSGVAELAVSDAMIDDYFRVRNVRVQYVLDYQPWSTGVGPDQDYPTTAKVLMYPAGGYVRGDGGTIDLGVVRDSVLNATNDYTAAWTEQMYLVAQMGPAAYEIEVSVGTANVGGYTGCCPPAAV